MALPPWPLLARLAVYASAFAALWTAGWVWVYERVVTPVVDWLWPRR